jgi:hypothetical protein
MNKRDAKKWVCAWLADIINRRAEVHDRGAAGYPYPEGCTDDDEYRIEAAFDEIQDRMTRQAGLAEAEEEIDDS